MADFKVQGRLGLDGSGFFSTLGRAEGAVGKLGGVLAGAFSVGAITAFSKSIIDLASSLNDVSDALGINVEFLQRFLNSARQSGGELGDIEKFLFESNKSRQDALNNPLGSNAKAFNKLGFSQHDISSLNPQQFIEKIIAAFKDGATPQQINTLSEIGGKSAKALVGGFKDGLDNVTQIISEDTIAVLDELGDKFTMIGTTLKATFAPFILTIVNFIQRVIDMAQAVAAFYTEILGGNGKAAAVDARDKVLLAQSMRDHDAEINRGKKRASNKARNEAPAGFSADPIKPEAGQKLYSDSRLAVGGFLGAGRTQSLASIAERQLQVQMQSLDIQKLMLAAFNKNPLSFIVP